LLHHKAAILLLERFETLGLFHSHTTIFLTPTVVGLFSNPRLLASFSRSHSLTDGNFNLP
jgi:hypothetical protein